jgi:hypothetical protein
MITWYRFSWRLLSRLTRDKSLREKYAGRPLVAAYTKLEWIDQLGLIVSEGMG